MSRPSGPKTRCNGQWTEARYRSFIISLLRRGTHKWAPKSQTQKDARVARGMYKCAGCGEHVPLSKREGRKKVQNVFVDHIEPVVDPAIGFTSWDDYIERMFCEQDNLQVLCKSCHDKKSAEERTIGVERRRKEKEEANNG